MAGPTLLHCSKTWTNNDKKVSKIQAIGIKCFRSVKECSNLDNVKVRKELNSRLYSNDTDD